MLKRKHDDNLPVVAYIKVMVKKSSKKPVKKTAKKTVTVSGYEPTMVALVVAFVASVSIVLFAVIALSHL